MPKKHFAYTVLDYSIMFICLLILTALIAAGDKQFKLYNDCIETQYIEILGQRFSCIPTPPNIPEQVIVKPQTTHQA